MPSAARAVERDASSAGSGRPRGPARRHAVGRLEAAPGARGLRAAPARSCCCSTSRPPAWTRRRAASSGTRSTTWRRGHHGAGHHALHGRGRALPQLVYIAYGRLLVQGTAEEVVARRRARRPGRGDRRRAAAVARAAARRAGRRAGRRRSARAARRRHRSAALEPRSRAPSPAPACAGSEVSRAGGRVHPPASSSGRRLGRAVMRFSLARLLAIVLKEFIQVRRDRITLRHDHRHAGDAARACSATRSTPIPSTCRPACLSADHSRYERSLVAALKNTGYYDCRRLAATRPRPSARWRAARCCSSSTFPPDFDRARGSRREAGDADRCRRDRPVGDRQRDGGAARRSATALDRDLPPVAASRCPRRRRSSSWCMPATIPEQLTALQHRARADRHRADDVDADASPRSRSPASASAARWRTCWRCRCVRSR